MSVAWNKNPIPSDLKAPVEETPWRFTPKVFEKITNQNSGRSYQKLELDPSSEEAKFVTKCFLNDPPGGRAISRIYAIYNNNATAIFENAIPRMNKEAQKEDFKPNLEKEPNLEQRKVAYLRWEKMVEPFKNFHLNLPNNRNESYEHVFVVPVWHGSSKERCDSACDSGITFFGKEGGHSTDIGFFGSGIYGTPSAKYATEVYSKDGHLLFLWLSMRLPFAMVSDVPSSKPCSDMKNARGKGAHRNFNAHFIPVVRADKSNPKCTVFHPCYDNEPPECDEFVVFQEKQTLITFWVEAGEILKAQITTPTLTVETFTDLIHTLLGKEEIKKDKALSAVLKKKLQELLKLEDTSILSQEDQSFYKWIIEQSKVGAVAAAQLKPAQVTPSLKPVSMKQETSFPKAESVKQEIKLEPKSIKWKDDPIVKTFSGHTSEVTFLLELQDGTIISQSKDGTLKSWDRQGNCLAATDCDNVSSYHLQPLKNGTLAHWRASSWVSTNDDIILWDSKLKYLTRLKGHTDRIKSLVELKDGILASLSKDGTLKLWNMQGNCLQTIEEVNCEKLTELKDGTLISTFSTDDIFSSKKSVTVKLWNSRWESLKVIEAYTFVILKNETLVTCSGKTIKLWDSQGNCLKTLLGHTSDVRALIELPDGILASYSEDNTIKLWDRKGNCVGTFMHPDRIYQLQGLQDGRLAVVSDKTIKFYDRNGNCLATLEGHTEHIFDFKELRGGTFVSHTSGRTVKLWDKNGTFLKNLECFSEELKNGLLVTGPSGFDTWSWESIKFWDSKGNYLNEWHGSDFIELKDGSLALQSHNEIFELWDDQCCFLNKLKGSRLIELGDGNLACTEDETFKLLSWNSTSSIAAKSKPIQKPEIKLDPRSIKWTKDPITRIFSGHYDTIGCVKELKDGTLATGADDKIIYLWDRKVEGHRLKEFVGHTDVIWSLIELKNGILASCSGDATIKFWDKQGETLDAHTTTLVKCLNTLTGHSGAVFSIIELTDGTLASGSADKTIKLWDSKGNCIKTLTGHHDQVCYLTELTDGTLASCSWDGTIKLWITKNRYPITLLGHSDLISSFIELKDGTLVSGSRDTNIKLWNRGGKCLKTLSGHTSSVTCLVELKEGTLASASYDNTIKIWDKQGNCLKTFKGDTTDNIFTLIELEDGILASSSLGDSGNGKLKLWDRNGNCLNTLKGSHLIKLADGSLACTEGKKLKTFTWKG